MNPQEADRVRKNKYQDPKRTFGLSSSMVFLLWAVMGTFLCHILKCNFLTMLIKPNYEKPVDTAEDILDRGLSVIKFPGAEATVEALKNSPLPLTRGLAEMSIVPKVSQSVKGKRSK